jgi:aspartyl-tRNA(Asn)/glutamyl-tRNA(Gln) amidotransferase subunit C
MSLRAGLQPDEAISWFAGDCFVAKNKSAPRNDMGAYMTQTIDTKTVQHVAYLVRLGISEEEAQTFSGQFSSIIDYFNMLNEVDTENVPPASDIANAENVLREDVVKPSMSREEFLKNAPKSERGYVKVPTVLSDE